ncbi:MAG: LysM peptidoglycan-binding domain-containing protein [Candidatus Promineifilaceae bacterium]|nr:LysM peptidoglycan-binding domain-containing protein [Candidatus Promineifilaceae bacterium]
MSDQSTHPSQAGSTAGDSRCPNCDSVVPKDAAQCIMCGTHLDVFEAPAEEQETPQPEIAAPLPAHDGEKVIPELFETTMRETKSRSLFWLALTIALLTLIVSFFLLRDPDGELTLAMVPSLTPLPPTMTFTPTWTPIPTETMEPTATASPTPPPAATDTPRPPRFHSVATGETLFGLSLFYRISPDSIAENNGMSLNSPIQVGQELLIPWPTATPPLESLLMEIKGETMVADVTDCEIVTIAEGDSAYGLSAEKGVPAEAIIAVNRLTEESIQLLHPGDTLCIPKVIPGDSLPPTPGPAPTITPTSYPSGPELLYPTQNAVLDPGDAPVALQWVAVKDLEENEWYMVELTDMDELDAIPYRGFTRDNAFRLPSSWRPEVEELRQMRWRVSIVQVSGQRADGGFIYRFGGQSSADGHFQWLGAIPTPTPTPTPVPTETPLP